MIQDPCRRSNKAMDKDDEAKRPGKLSKTHFKAFNERDNQPPPSSDIERKASKKKKEFQKYEALEIFKKPVQLIFADETKRLRFNDEAIAELQKVDHDVNVVAVVGLYRTGKSLLLNRLAGENNAFDVGHTCNAETKGVWIMCLPHPTQESQVLVLLDTEGLGAVQEVKFLEDRWHFLLASLLASTLVYNHKGVLDADAIQKLVFLKEIKSSLSILETDVQDDSYFDVFFSSFIMVLRDFSLKLVDKTTPITADQYLEIALVLKRGSSDSIREYNLPRELVRRYFKNRKRFTFATPKAPHKLDEGTLWMNSDFEKDVEAFREYIYQCKPKQMTSGKTLNGRMFGSLVGSYVRFIQDRKPPCVHTAVKEMIEYENQNLVLAAQNVYKAEMKRLFGEYLPEEEAMAQFHVQSTEKAIEYLRAAIIYDDVEVFTGTAMEAFEKVLDRFIKSTTEDSEKMCWHRVRYLDTTRIKKKIHNKAYQHISGYDEYIRDIEWIIKQYSQTVGLGPKKSHVLKSYLDEKEAEENIIFLMVKEAQNDTSAQKPNSRIPQLTKAIYREGTLKLKNAVQDELSKTRRALQETFTSVGNEKFKEYERQVQEGFENAPVTEQENKRFVEIFLTTEESEPDIAPDTITDEEKQPEYESHQGVALEAAPAPDNSQLQSNQKDTFDNRQDDPTYDFVDNPPGRRPKYKPRKQKKCKIL